MGQEALTSMLQEAVRKRLLGDVDSIEVAEYIPGKLRVCVRWLAPLERDMGSTELFVFVLIRFTCILVCFGV